MSASTHSFLRKIQDSKIKEIDTEMPRPLTRARKHVLHNPDAMDSIGLIRTPKDTDAFFS